MPTQTSDTPLWAQAVGATILVTIFAVITLVAAGGWDWFAHFLESSAAGWLQAFGSLAAVVTGTATIVWQVKQQAKEASARSKRVEIERLQTLYYMFFNARAHLHEVQIAAKHGQDATSHLRRFDYFISRLAEFPLFEVPSWTVVQSIEMAQQQARLIPEIWKIPGGWTHRTILLGNILSQFRAHEAAVKALLEDRGGDIPNPYLQIEGRHYSPNTF